MGNKMSLGYEILVMLPIPTWLNLMQITIFPAYTKYPT